MRTRFRQGVRVALVAIASAMVWNVGRASACACGDPDGVVVAHGTSLYGVPWRIKARLERSRLSKRHTIDVHFSIGRKGDNSDVGYFTGLGLPLHPAFVFTANVGSEINEFPESDLSGVTRGRVSTLVIEMNNGESLNVQPNVAPIMLRQRFKWLRGLGFFDVFFPAGQRPLAIVAFDRRGRRLARRLSHRGIFYRSGQ